jgi:5-(carboxyamino)imidazole ribonucleotide synthase
MLALAGIPLGLEFRFLDPSADAPAGPLGTLVVGALGDEASLEATADGADVVTYEWEGVPAHAARFLSGRLPVRPGPRSLEASQDRVAEKETFGAVGIDTPAFAPVGSREELRGAVDEIGIPSVLKTRRGGYDGKGQHVLRSAADLDAAWTALGDVPLVLEELVPFTRELSIVAVRELSGAVAYWPVVENVHQHGILRVTHAPAPGLDPGLDTRAQEFARHLMSHLDHVGVLAIELFEVDGRLLANEFAPRVHNSGHWTIEGAVTSQFENHLRAVLGSPVGDTSVSATSAMVNCIGAMPERESVLAIPGAHFHDYGKAPRPGRKLGHVTLTSLHDDRSGALEARIEQVQSLLAVTEDSS